MPVFYIQIVSRMHNYRRCMIILKKNEVEIKRNTMINNSTNLKRHGIITFTLQNNDKICYRRSVT